MTDRPGGELTPPPPHPTPSEATTRARAHRPGGRPLPPRTTPRRRSPLIAPGPLPALFTTALAALLAVTAPLGRPVLALPVALLQAVTAAGWFRLNGMWPARQGIALAFAAGLAADVALLATGGDHAPSVLIGTLGAWWPLLLVLQLGHRGASDERLAALTATTSATVVALLPACLLVADHPAVVVGAAATAAAACARALPLPSPVAFAVAPPAAVGAAVAANRWLVDPSGDTVGWAACGLAVGLAALLGLRVSSYDYPSRFVHLTAGVALPLAAAAPVLALPGPWG